MSFLQRLVRLNPLRVARTVDAVPQLQALGGKLREDHKAVVRELRTVTHRLEELQQRLEQLAGTLTSQQEILAALPRLQNDVERCVTAYTSDVRAADRLLTLRGILGDGAHLTAHAASAVARAPLDVEPFPHVVIEDLLPPDVFDALIEALPSSVFFTQDRKRQELKVPFVFAPEYSRVVWRLFFDTVITQALVPALTEKFGPLLDDFVRANWPEFRSMADAGISLRVSNTRLLLRRPGYVIKPHRDPRWAFLTCLVYLPKPGEQQSYGTQLYRLRHEPAITHRSPLWMDTAECEFAREVPARRNTALVFLNSAGAHGASIPPDAPPDTERFLYQVQFGVDNETQQRLIGSLAETARTPWVAERERGYE